MLNLSEVKFINEATSATTSEVFDNYKGNTITLQASGTASAIVFKLEGKTDIGAEWKEIAVINLKDFSVTSSMNSNDIYQTGIDGVTKIRINLTSVTGGNVTIFGRITN